MRGDAAEAHVGRTTPRLRIAGLGSPHGDDQLGWAAVERIRLMLGESIATHKVGGGAGLIDLFEESDDVIIIDAAAPAGCPGRLTRFEWPCDAVHEADLVSTHGLDLVAALRLAERLGVLPRRVRIFAIEAFEVAPGHPLSPAAERGLEEAVAEILREIGT
jgi:hydrogenase maturation protease